VGLRKPLSYDIYRTVTVPVDLLILISRTKDKEKQILLMADYERRFGKKTRENLENDR
jgi:hypothetical protein